MRRLRVGMPAPLLVLAALALWLAPWRRVHPAFVPMGRPIVRWMPLGQTQAGWHLVGDWRVGSWSNRMVEWDEPPDAAHDTPGQVYRYWGWQAGPLNVWHRRRVVPGPSEVAQCQD